MNWCHGEPTLDEILSDSIVRAVMEADGVDPRELAATLKQTGRKLVGEQVNGAAMHVGLPGKR
jgi:hypothetical protein